MTDFIIIGNTNAVIDYEIFPYIRENKLWLGVSPRGLNFILPNGEISNVNAVWYTNIENKKRNTPLDLYKRYSNEYPHYENYDAIEVPKTCDIPMDYDGVMSVPITFLDKYNPEQFEIISSTNDTTKLKELGVKPLGKRTIEIMNEGGNFSHLTANMVQLYYFENGKFKRPFSRLLIRKRTD
jgi:hypothetical protein